MSFSAQTKNEIARIFPEKECCQLAELAALIRMDGTVSISGNNNIGLSITTENAAVSRKIFTLIKKMFGLELEVRVRRKIRLRKNNVYAIRVPAQTGVTELLQKTGILDEKLRFYYRIMPALIRSECCKRAFLRGTFLGSGSVTNPGRTYHLEITTNSDALSKDLCRLLNHFGLGAKVSQRKNEYVVYLKGSDFIAKFLSLIGAHSALLEFENVRIIKGMKNQVNRIVNCETANLNKTVNAAIRQNENIRLIESTIGLKKLPPDLQQVAYLRLQNPEMSLKELGNNLVPPVGKSGVNHRMRRLEKIADKLRKGEKWDVDEE